MILFALGIILGVVLTIPVLLITLWNKPLIERTMKQTQSRLLPKGSIMEPESEELDDWINTLPHEITS